VALFHHHTLKVAVSGLTVITVYKVLFAPFRDGAGLAGLGTHLVHEWVVIANLGLLLTGFALLARQFEESGVPESLPRVLPPGWGGGFALLGLVFVLSSFLDNIAAALIGATVAKIVFPSVHIGYLAAIVAASNAGGSGSVVGDTTTMMWIDGVSLDDACPPAFPPRRQLTHRPSAHAHADARRR
jgi:Na+/H+ antiporter NhaD/arsenite permease-like protein